MLIGNCKAAAIFQVTEADPAATGALSHAVAGPDAPGNAALNLQHVFHGDTTIWGDWGFEPINQMRAELGLPPLSGDADTVFVELQRRCEVELVVMPVIVGLPATRGEPVG